MTHWVAEVEETINMMNGATLQTIVLYHLPSSTLNSLSSHIEKLFLT